MSEWLVFAIFIYILKWHYINSAILSFILATAVNYILSLCFVFKSGRHVRQREIVLVYMVSIIGLFINLVVLSALVEWTNLYIFIAKIAATGVAFLWNFMSRYFWIFERS